MGLFPQIFLDGGVTSGIGNWKFILIFQCKNTWNLLNMLTGSPGTPARVIELLMRQDVLPVLTNVDSFSQYPEHLLQAQRGSERAHRNAERSRMKSKRAALRWSRATMCWFMYGGESVPAGATITVSRQLVKHLFANYRKCWIHTSKIYICVSFL